MNHVAFSPDGKVLATASGSLSSSSLRVADDTAQLWDVVTGKEITGLTHTHEGLVFDVAFSPDGKVLATASGDKTARLWDVASGRELTRLTHEATVSDVAFSPDGKVLATASGNSFDFEVEDKTARLWDVATGTERARLTHEGRVSYVAFSPDGKTLATASDDKTARLWAVDTGTERARLTHEGGVTHVAFSPDGKTLATASYDKTARLWAVDTGKELARLTHEDTVSDVAFSPDGKVLATASGNSFDFEVADNTARLWDVATGKELARLTHEREVIHVAFSPDGKTLATASADQTARLSLWRPEDMIAEACSRLNRNLTRAEWQQYLGDEPYLKTCADLPIGSDFFDEGRKLAKEGKLEEAIAIFREARSADPSLTFDPEVEAHKLAAPGLVEKGKKLAEEGQWQEAIAIFREARSFDPSLTLDPDSEARKLAAPGLVKNGRALAKDGKVQEARAKYAETQQFYPALEISAEDWNVLCWDGSVAGHATEVMDACQKAVALDPENGGIRDSRGLARALTGDGKDAIEDFQFYLKWTEKIQKFEDRRPQREKWITDLKAGKNPFDAETLEKLRGQ